MTPQSLFSSYALLLVMNTSMKLADWVLLFTFVLIAGYSQLEFSLTADLLCVLLPPPRLNPGEMGEFHGETIW